MAMARAAIRVAPLGCLSSSSSLFRRSLASEAMAVLPPAPPLDMIECVDDAPLISHQGQSVKTEAKLPCKSGFTKVKATDLRSFLEEQRENFIELQNQLKDQHVLLSLIGEELSSYECEPKALKELDVSARRASSQANAESISEAESEMFKREAEKVSCGRTALCESISENGKPIILSEESSESDASMSKKGFDADKFQHPPWPEWESFLDCLRPYASFKDGKQKDEIGELFDDTSLLKHALVKFAQSHKAVFRKLSRKDLVMLVQHELPSMDKKTEIGKKKIRSYLVMDENEVAQAKLTDVVRLIYRAVRSVPLLGGALQNDLESAIIHILQDLVSASITKHDSSSGTMERNDKRIAKGGEVERMNNMTNIVDGEAVFPTASPSSTNQAETISMTGASLELPKFGSLKERVDVRRARLAKERMEKEAAKSMLEQPLLAKESEQKTPKVCCTQKDNNCKVVRNIRAFDAIIDSEDSDSGETSDSQAKGVNKTSLSSLVRKNGSGCFLRNEGAQHHTGQQRNKKGGKATGR